MLFDRQSLFLYVLLAVSVGYLVSAISLGAPISDSNVTPSFFPIILGIASTSFATTLVFQNRSRFEAPASRVSASRAHLWIIAVIFAYIVAFRPLGYFISSSLFVFALLIIFSSAGKLVQKALISLAIVGSAYIMFQQLFGVRLPTLWG